MSENDRVDVVLKHGIRTQNKKYSAQSLLLLFANLGADMTILVRWIEDMMMNWRME